MTDAAPPRQYNADTSDSSKSSFAEVAESGLKMPVVTRQDAKKRGEMYYWSGVACSKGHNSRRNVKTGACAACLYLYSISKNNRTRQDAAQAKAEVISQRAMYTLGPKAKQKILETYAKTGDLEETARTMDMSLAQLNVQIAKSSELATAVNSLERRMKAAKENSKELYKPAKVKWTDELRETFIRAYVDTGDIAFARETIGCSASEYYDELERSETFSQAVKEAEPKANQALEEKAVNLALKGNDKLLTLTLKAKKPEYKDKIQVEQTTTIKLSDDQLLSRAKQLLAIYDAEFTELEPEGTGRISHEPRRIESKEN